MKKTIKADRIIVSGYLRKIILLLLPMIFLLVVSGYAQMREAFVDIPTQKIGKALETLAVKTDISLVFSSADVKNIRSNAISGKYSPTQALKIMLEGTGLVFQQAGEQTITIQKDHHQAQVESQPKDDSSETSNKKADPLPTSSQANNTNKIIQSDKVSDPKAEKAEGESWDDFMLEDTVVTASKRDVKVQSIPMSIQAITGEKLEAFGAVGMDDFINRVPGLTKATSGMGGASVQIRGIASFANSGTASATVGYYLDDVPMSSGDRIPDSALFDLERIEVLKGPQGTLYGEGSLGGTIRMITNKPRMNEFEGKIQPVLSQTEGSDGFNYQINALVNAPIVDGKLALRLTGSYIDDAGFVDDISFGIEDSNSYDKVNVRGTFRFTPLDRLAISPSILYQKNDAGSPAYASDLYPDLTYARLMPFNDERIDEFQIYSLSIEADLGWAELVSSTSYYDRQYYAYEDQQGDNGTVNAVLFYFLGAPPTSPYQPQLVDSSTETFIQELRMVSTGEGPLSWVVGGIYRNKVYSSRVLLENDLITFHSGGTMPVVFDIDYEQTSQQIALFGDVNYDIMNKVVLIAGARVFQEKIEGDMSFKQLDVAGVFSPEIDQDDLLFKLAVNFYPIENAMLYAQYTQGIRPGGINERAIFYPAGTVADVFESDSTENYELGIKSDWINGRIRVNAAAYYIDWKDIQVLDIGTGPVDPTFIVNAGRAKSTGFETEIAAKLTSGLTVGLNLGYNKSETNEETITGTGTILNGKPLPHSPELTYNLYAEYNYPVYSGVAFAGGDLMYVDERTSTIEKAVNSMGFVTYDDYYTVDLRAGFTTDTWGINIFATNLLDERAKVAITRTQNTGWHVNQPRTIGIQLTYNF